MQVYCITFFIPTLVKIELKYRKVRRVEVSQATNISRYSSRIHSLLLLHLFFVKQQSLMFGVERTIMKGIVFFFFLVCFDIGNNGLSFNNRYLPSYWALILGTKK